MDSSRVTPEVVLAQLEAIEAFLRVPSAAQLTADQRKMKLVLLQSEFPETSTAHLCWCVAQWMERCGSEEFRRFPSWEEVLAPLYIELNGRPSRAAGYKKTLCPFLQPAAWQLEALQFGLQEEAAQGASQLAPAPEGGSPLPAPECEAAAFFARQPDHPAALLYRNKPPKRTGLAAEDWDAYVRNVDAGAPPSAAPDPVLIKCQERLEKFLAKGLTSVAAYNADVPTAAVVYPRQQFLRDNPLFRDPFFRDTGRVAQKREKKNAKR